VPGYETLWRNLPGLDSTRVPERLMPVACLALAALVAVAASRLHWPGTVTLVALLLLVDLHVNVFEPTAADEDNRAYAALHSSPPGRLLELPVFLPDRQEASVYLYYVMQAPREHPSGYSTTAPRAVDRELRRLLRGPCRDLAALGVRYLAVHGLARACRGQLVARDGPIALYRIHFAIG
jgi:hypothetical protein